jgi:hypothetical protein
VAEGEVQNSGVGAQAAPSGVGASAPATPPAGRTIDDATWDRFQRIEQQYKGSQPLIEAALGLGFKKPEDFASLKAIKDRGIDFNRLASTFDAPVEDDTKAEVDYEKLMNDKIGGLKREWAEKEHKSQYEAALKRLEKEAEQWAGDDAPADYKTFAKMAAREKYWEMAQDYEDGHPLKGSHVKPLDDAGFTKLADWFKSEREKAKGAGMAEIAKAANKPSSAPKPTAGSQGNQGKAETKTTDKESIDDRIRARAAAAVGRD